MLAGRVTLFTMSDNYGFDAGVNVNKDIFLLFPIEKSAQAGYGELSQDGSSENVSPNCMTQSPS